MRWRTAAAAAMLAFASLPAVAESEAERLAAARDLMEEMGGEALIDGMIGGTLEAMWPIIAQQNLKANEKALAAFREELEKAYREEAGRMVDETARIYARHLSVRELTELAAFYRTPTGKAVLAKMPVIAEESMTAGAAIGADVSAKAIEKARERLKKRGFEL